MTNFSGKLIICAIFVTFYQVTSTLSSPSNHRFGYSKVEQRRWSKRHESCAGLHQSPIAINSHKAVPIYMPAIEMIGYHNLLQGPIKIHNNGHSVSLSLPIVEASEENYERPYIFGGKLKNEYELEGLHFHWGDKNNRGSEHVINDIRFPLEMHIIHRNRKYKNVPEALTYSDGLTVLGFFFHIQEKESTELTNLARSFSSISGYDENVKLNHTFTLASLIGDINLDRFYTYMGSLTTPPCSEAVTWILFPESIPVSISQMHKFRQLSDGNSILVDNYRTLQPIGNRRVFLRKINARNTQLDSFLNENQVHYSKWDWLF